MLLRSQTHLDPSKVKKAGDTMTGALAIEGSADESQLVIQANAAQTEPLVLVNADGGGELFRVYTNDPKNLFIGFQSGQSLTSGVNNTAFGGNTLQDVTSGDNNVALGYFALPALDTGDGNMAIGNGAGQILTEGNDNVAIGAGAGNGITSGSDNMCIGALTLQGISTDSNNTAVGSQAMRLAAGNTSVAIGRQAGFRMGSLNVAIGYRALYSNATTRTANSVAVGYGAGQDLQGNNNVAIGYQALNNALNEPGNSVIGFQAGFNVGIGSYNSFFGYRAGYASTGDKSVLIGFNVGFTSLTGSNLLGIDYEDTADPLIYGEFDNDLVRVNGHQEVIGNADTEQLIVKANATQTDDIVQVQNSAGTNLAVVDGTGKVGIGTGSPATPLHVDQSVSDAAIPVLTLDQADISEEMIEFVTTIGTGNAIEAVAAKTLTTTHFIKVTIPGGLTRYIPCGTIA